MILQEIKNILIKIMTVILFIILQVIKGATCILVDLINIIGIIVKLFLFFLFTAIKTVITFILKGIPFFIIFLFQFFFDIFIILISSLINIQKYVIKFQKFILRKFSWFYYKLIWLRFVVSNVTYNRLFRQIIIKNITKTLYKYKIQVVHQLNKVSSSLIKKPIISCTKILTTITIKSKQGTLNTFNSFFHFINIFIKFFINSILLCFFITKSLYCFLISFFKFSTYKKFLITFFSIITLVTKEVYHDLKIFLKLLLKLPFTLKNIFIKVCKLSKERLIFSWYWSKHYYFKTLFLLGMAIIVIINVNIFFNNKTAFNQVLYTPNNNISIANAIPACTNLIKNLKDNSLVKYQKISLNIKDYTKINNELIKNNVNQDEADQIFKAIKNMAKTSKFFLKGEIQATLTTSKQKEGDIRVAQLEIPLNNTHDLIIEPAENSIDFAVYTKKKKITKYLIKQKFIIEENYYESAKKSNIPSSIVNIMGHILSWHIDFQREINPGNSVEILYQCLYNDNQLISCNNLVYASIQLKHKTLTFYNYGGKYYLSNGRSAATALLRTPVEGYRVSSPFGKRSHPILGYSIFHKGVDFAAPTGTPVPAAGNGIIKKIVVSPTYGKYIEIQHNAYLSTVYAHLNAFAQNLKVGQKVTQREIIGYVGATGLATGPHLHYEIHFNGKPVNPMDVKIPSLVYLTEESLVNFNKFKEEIYHILLKLPVDQKSAIDFKNI